MQLYIVHGYLMRPAGGSLPLHQLAVAEDEAGALLQALDEWRRLFGDSATLRAHSAVAVESVGGYAITVVQREAATGETA